MSRISVKYKSSASAEDISSVEKKFNLVRKSQIAVLRIYGYDTNTENLKQIEQDSSVEYVEEQQDMTIA